MNRYVWVFVDNGSDSHEPLVFGSKKRAMSIYQKNINDLKDEAVEIVEDSSEYGSAATVIFDDGMEYSLSVSKIYIQ